MRPGPPLGTPYVRLTSRLGGPIVPPPMIYTPHANRSSCTSERLRFSDGGRLSGAADGSILSPFPTNTGVGSIEWSDEHLCPHLERDMLHYKRAGFRMTEHQTLFRKHVQPFCSHFACRRRSLFFRRDRSLGTMWAENFACIRYLTEPVLLGGGVGWSGEVRIGFNNCKCFTHPKSLPTVPIGNM